MVISFLANLLLRTSKINVNKYSSTHHYSVSNKVLSVYLPSEWSEVAQSCLTLYDSIDRSLPGLSIHGIFQARVLEWVAISFSRGSSRPRDQTWVSRIVGRRFTVWVTTISDTLEQKQYCWMECVTFQGGGFEMQHALTCMHACIANVVFPLYSLAFCML